MSVNKVILVGNLGRDPELRYTGSGVPVCNFSVATTERFKDKDGNRRELTEWHNIVIWRQLAEIAGKYLTKGKQVYLEGKLQTQKWEDRDGNPRYTTEVVCDVMRMLGRVGDNNEATQQEPSDNQAPPVHSGADQAPPMFNPDDDIPFAMLPAWMEDNLFGC